MNKQSTKVKVLSLQQLDTVRGGQSFGVENTPMDWSTTSNSCGGVGSDEWSTSSNGCR
jgi:hypothetical protein